MSQKEKQPSDEEVDIHQPNDRLFGQLMSDKNNVAAYLRHFYPDLAEKADLDTLQIDESQQSVPKLKLFRMDVLYRCQRKGRQDKGFYFALLFEHKSSPDRHVAVQVGAYIMQRLKNQSKEVDTPLEPIIPLVFYNGETPWAPLRLRELFKDYPEYELFRPYLPDFDFLYLDAAKLPVEQLTSLELGVPSLRPADYGQAASAPLDV